MSVTIMRLLCYNNDVFVLLACNYLRSNLASQNKLMLFLLSFNSSFDNHGAYIWKVFAIYLCSHS